MILARPIGAGNDLQRQSQQKNKNKGKDKFFIWYSILAQRPKNRFSFFKIRGCVKIKKL